MAQDRNEDDPPSDLQQILDALEDPDSRTIIAALDEPMTAKELSQACDIPRSTLYRKLDGLTESGLVSELPTVRDDKHHTTRYRAEFQSMTVRLTETREFEVRVDRPERTAGDRLAEMWSRIGDEL